jgi:hypothetical protein
MSGFMSGIIGKTEWVATTAADILRVAASAGQEMDDVAGHNARHGMANLPRDGLLLEERMATVTRVFFIAVPRRHLLRAMAEQATEISDLFLEGGGRCMRIVRRFEQQRMPALQANVFVAAIAVAELFVLVRAQKAGKCVPNPRRREIFAEIRRPAAAAAVAGRMLENVVVHMMSPHCAREFGQ